jgi:hypothetical protein
MQTSPTELKFAQKGNEKVLCINCDHRFEIKVADRFIRGPFPA